MKPLVGTELKRFLRDYRRQHRPDYDLVVLLQSVEYPYNVGSIFRLADGAGLTELVLTGITPTPPNPTIEKVA
ncbi:MAG: tRNA methyltransferase, partial [Chloroflexi bacterium]|nr:tRNA methyltransferase [Chloroflexota bacterium]